MKEASGGDASDDKEKSFNAGRAALTDERSIGIEYFPLEDPTAAMRGALNSDLRRGLRIKSGVLAILGMEDSSKQQSRCDVDQTEMDLFPDIGGVIAVLDLLELRRGVLIHSVER